MEKKNNKNFNFEQTLKELENIVSQFNSDEIVNLDTAFENYQQGVGKYLTCLDYLKKIENDVIILNDKIQSLDQ